MRKIFGALLVLVGVFAAALAILLPTVVVPASKKIPLDLNLTTVATGPGKVLDTATNQTRDVTLQATRIVRTDSHHSDSDRTTVKESLCIMVASGSNTPGCVAGSDPRRLALTTDTVTVKRKNGEAVHVAGWGENVNGDTSVRHQGLAYAFPIDTAKRTYRFFQPDVQRAFPAVYSGSTTLRGLTVYKFVSRTGDVDRVGGKPYLLRGIAPATYNDTRTVYVEPRTGVIVKGIEHQTVTLQNESEPALETTLTFTGKTIDAQADYAKNKIDALRLAGLWLPIILAVVAVLALGGAFLLLRGGRAEPQPAATSEPVPENEPVPSS